MGGLPAAHSGTPWGDAISGAQTSSPLLLKEDAGIDFRMKVVLEDEDNDFAGVKDGY
jgi:hypothetical protein